MSVDARFVATRFDHRFEKSKKKRQPVPAQESSAEEEDHEEDVLEEGVTEDNEESIDMDRVNELLGMDQEEVDAWSDDSSEAKVVEESTRRLALMNYDWSKINAGDLMIAFSSFLPDGGQLKKVSVYPSDFGIQRMKQEETEGPGDIFKPEAPAQPEEPEKNDKKKKKNSKDDQPQKQSKAKRQDDIKQWTADAEKQGSALDLAKLRRYERERLKYYYAVLVFDSGKTADAVFEACNGFELEKTGIKIGNTI